MKIVLLGSGNMATQLGLALKQKGHTLAAVWSRTASNGKKLSTALGCPCHKTVSSLPSGCDVYIIALKDDLIRSTAKKLRPVKGIVLHTSGFSNLDTLKGCALHYGVIWPLQTISKGRKADLRKVPFITEGNDAFAKRRIHEIVSGLSDRVIPLSSGKRKKLHLAAVFASNFTNHMYTLSEKLARQSGVSFNILHPLIIETMQKALELGPSLSQTGPAMRKDKKVMKEHIRMLKGSKNLRVLYSLMSRSIQGK